MLGTAAQQVAVPDRALELCDLQRIDYADAFRIARPDASQRTALTWAHTAFTEAPLAWQTVLYLGWSALGLRLGAADDPLRVLGWEIERDLPDAVVLRAGSRVGLPARMVVLREKQALVLAVLVMHGNALARGLWAAVGIAHRPVAARLLGRLRLHDKRAFPPH